MARPRCSRNDPKRWWSIGEICQSVSMTTRVVVAVCAIPNPCAAAPAATASPVCEAVLRNRLLDKVFMPDFLSQVLRNRRLANLGKRLLEKAYWPTAPLSKTKTWNRIPPPRNRAPYLQAPVATANCELPTQDVSEYEGRHDAGVALDDV